MAFPGSIPSYLGFTASHTLLADTHAAQHNQEQADIIALATKMGTGASTPAAGQVLTATGTGTSSWSEVNLTTMVSGVLPVANGGTGQSTIAGLLPNIYPVGCIYTETTGVNPGITFGFGTWSAFGQGRVLVGNGSSDQAFAAGATGGESNHILTSTEMPSHVHHQNSDTWYNIGGTFTASSAAGLNMNVESTATGTPVKNTLSAGSDGAHNNLQPYIVVYFWKRTG